MGGILVRTCTVPEPPAALPVYLDGKNLVKVWHVLHETLVQRDIRREVIDGIEDGRHCRHLVSLERMLLLDLFLIVPKQIHHETSDELGGEKNVPSQNGVGRVITLIRARTEKTHLQRPDEGRTKVEGW